MKLLELDVGEEVENPDMDKFYKRLELTYEFISHYKKDHKNCLNLGGIGEFGMTVASRLNLEYYNTNGDLNLNDWHVTGDISKFDMIFCFRVLEMLLNPLLCLSNMRSYCSDNTLVFIFYPKNPHCFEGKHHFHHFTDREFYTLITVAGFEIIGKDRIRLWSKWKYYFTGFRPIVKFFLLLFGISRGNLYVLRKTKREVYYSYENIGSYTSS